MSLLRTALCLTCCLLPLSGAALAAAAPDSAPTTPRQTQPQALATGPGAHRCASRRFALGRTLTRARRLEPRARLAYSTGEHRALPCAALVGELSFWRQRVRELERPQRIAARLERVLQGTPLAGRGALFERSGRRWNVSPFLLVAISGKESSFGRNCFGYNCFGWGCPGGRCGQSFSSHAAAIDTVAEGPRRSYLARGATSVGQIGTAYCPSSPGWISDVSWLMGRFGEHGVTYR